jgi:ubiquinone/menaquinone biosynthesis C-methylase UbiE
MDLVEKLSKNHQFISPISVLASLGLRDGMTVVDYASGAGHWSVAAAKLVAPKGSVLAIENNINMLNLLKSKADTQSLRNIEVEEIELEKGTSKSAKPADLVIVSNILHLIKDKESFVAKAARMVAPNGKLLFIDWSPIDTMFGPPLEMRISRGLATKLFEGAGLQGWEDIDTGADHFGIVFINKGVSHDK